MSNNFTLGLSVTFNCSQLWRQELSTALLAKANPSQWKKLQGPNLRAAIWPLANNDAWHMCAILFSWGWKCF